MKKTTFKRIFSVLLAALLLALPALAFAEGDTSITASADNTSVKAGDSVTVTVVVSGSKLAAVQGSFTYDPAILTYVSATGGAGDGTLSMISAEKGGSASMTAVIKFTATGAGESAIEFSADSAYDYSGAQLGASKAGVSITVTGPDCSDAPAIDLSVTGVPASNVEGATEDMYIWRSLTELTLPSGYADRQVSYNGEYVGGAAIADTEEPLLLYLSNVFGENGAYYIYDTTENLLYPYTTLSASSASYTIIRSNGVTPPEGYEPAVFQLSETKSIDAWLPLGGDGSVYLVYARASDGTVGFYIYDVENRSIQRYMAPPIVPTPEPTPEPTPDPSVVSMGKPVYYAMLGGIGVLVIALIVALVLPALDRKRRKAAREAKRKANLSGEA